MEVTTIHNGTCSSDCQEEGICQIPVNPKDALQEANCKEANKIDPQHTSKLKEFQEILAQKNVEVKEEAEAMRFLRARGMQAKEAAKMAVEDAAWRAEVVPGRGWVEEKEVEAILRHKVAHLQGLSKARLPLLVLLARNHSSPPSSLVFQRFVVYVLDKALASAPKGIDKILAIVDLKGIGIKNMDLKSMILGLQTLQNHYPERLGRLYFLNTSTLFCKFWKYASHFVDKVTKEKLNFLPPGNISPLLQDVDDDILPVHYGGKAEMIPIQDAYVPFWPPTSKESKDVL